MDRQNDIFAMLDKASVFSTNKTMAHEQSNEFIKPKDKKSKQKKQISPTKHTRTAEEKEYAKLIGYESDSNESCAEEFSNDFANYMSNSKSIENGLSRMNVSQNGYQKNGYYQPPNNGFGVGRGRLLNSVYNNVVPSRNGKISDKTRLPRNRQEQNDRVIGEQLREIGVAVSNEEIENAFLKKFKKSPVTVEDNDNSKKESDSLSTTSSKSCRSSKSSSQSKREISYYVPPHKRCESVDSFSLLGEKSAVKQRDNDHSQFDPINYKPLPPIKFPEPDIHFTASKVEHIYDVHGDCFEDSDQENKDDIRNFNSYGDVEIISIEDDIKNDKLMPGFGQRDKDNSPKLSGRGRNALINGLLNKNPNLREKINESEELGVKDIKNGRCEKLDCDFITKDINPLIDKCSSRLVDNSSRDNSASSIPSWSSKVSNVTNNSSCKQDIRSSKTFVQSVVENSKNTRKPRKTLGDFILPDSSSSLSMPLNKSVLNPDAPSFNPSLFSSNNKKAYDFKLNYDNFPPLS